MIVPREKAPPATAVSLPPKSPPPVRDPIRWPRLADAVLHLGGPVAFLAVDAEVERGGGAVGGQDDGQSRPACAFGVHRDRHNDDVSRGAAGASGRPPGPVPEVRRRRGSSRGR